LQSIQQKGGLT